MLLKQGFTTGDEGVFTLSFRQETSSLTVCTAVEEKNVFRIVRHACELSEMVLSQSAEHLQHWERGFAVFTELPVSHHFSIAPAAKSIFSLSAFKAAAFSVSIPAQLRSVTVDRVKAVPSPAIRIRRISGSFSSRSLTSRSSNYGVLRL